MVQFNSQSVSTAYNPCDFDDSPTCPSLATRYAWTARRVMPVYLDGVGSSCLPRSRSVAPCQRGRCRVIVKDSLSNSCGVPWFTSCSCCRDCFCNLPPCWGGVVVAFLTGFLRFYGFALRCPLACPVVAVNRWRTLAGCLLADFLRLIWLYHNRTLFYNSFIIKKCEKQG